MRWVAQTDMGNAAANAFVLAGGSYAVTRLLRPRALPNRGYRKRGRLHPARKPRSRSAGGAPPHTQGSCNRIFVSS